MKVQAYIGEARWSHGGFVIDHQFLRPVEVNFFTGKKVINFEGVRYNLVGQDFRYLHFKGPGAKRLLVPA